MTYSDKSRNKFTKAAERIIIIDEKHNVEAV